MQSGADISGIQDRVDAEHLGLRGCEEEAEMTDVSNRPKAIHSSKDPPKDFGAISKFFRNVHLHAQRIVLPRNQRDDDTDGIYTDKYKQPFLPMSLGIVSIVEIAVFAYYIQSYGVELPRHSPLIYNPNRRYEVWRYVSYMLIHSGWMHISMNIAIQLILGILLEMVHGHWRVCLVYISGVIAGSLGTSIADPNTFLSGASGGVYAIMAAHLSTIIMNYAEMDYVIAQLLCLLVLVAASFGDAIYSRYFVKHLNNRTSYAAHLAGALAGLLIGIVALRNLKKHKWEKALQWFCGGTYIVLVGAMIVWNVAVPSHFPASK